MFELKMHPIEEEPGNHFKGVIVFMLSVAFVLFWILYGVASTIN